MTIQASDLTILATKLNDLKQALAWDLATLKANANGGATARLELLGMPPGKPPIVLYLNTRDFEELFATKIETLINELEAAGVSVTEIIQQFQKAGHQLLSPSQENKQGVDNVQGL